MVSLTIVALSVVIATIFYYLSKSKNGKNPPPGPIAYPVIGNILSIGKSPHLTFSSWVKYYGNLFMVRMMGIKMLIISDHKLAREAYNNPVFVGAPDLEIFQVFSDGKYGLLSTSGHQWVELRRFTLRHLRDYGFGKNTMEGRIMNEVTEFVEMLKASEGKPVPIRRNFQLVVVNSLWSIMGGQRFSLDDKKLNDMLDASNKAFNDTTESPIPITNDFTETFLHEMSITTDPASTFYKEDGEKNLRATIGGLFGAGSGTTSDTLTFAILYLTTWTKYQVLVQEEIDRVVGKGRSVCLEDRKNMLFLQAVIQETLRFSSLAPLGLFHATLEDATLCDYTIPKGTWVAVNHHHIHRNKEIWGEDVDTFNPYRHLSEDRKTILRNDALIPFSIGKRACVGESLARDEIFLFLSNVLQKFTVSFDPSAPNPPVESATSLFNSPHMFQVVVKDRRV